MTTLDSTDKIVVKVSPPGLEPVRNRDMLRQSRAQKALAGSPVPVPPVIAEDGGAPPEIPPYFAMEMVPGECVELAFLPPDSPRSPGEPPAGGQCRRQRHFGDPGRRGHGVGQRRNRRLGDCGLHLSIPSR